MCLEWGLTHSSGEGPVTLERSLHTDTVRAGGEEVPQPVGRLLLLGPVSLQPEGYTWHLLLGGGVGSLDQGLLYASSDHDLGFVGMN